MRNKEIYLNQKLSLISYYLRIVLSAALIFGLTHGSQTIIVYLLNNKISSINVSFFVTLAFFEMVQSLVFSLIGLIFIYPLSQVLKLILRKSSNLKQTSLSITVGTFFGLCFLPLCAAVAFLSLHDPDSPSYLARCLEFFVPMIAAGAFGGYMASGSLAHGAKTSGYF